MNVLYVTVDALRADHVRPDVMPTMESFAAEAVTFSECVANGPGTPWSFPSLLASRYAGSTDGFGIPPAGDGHPTLAEVLSEAGFTTAGFTDNRFASSAYHYDRGFDSMHDSGATSRVKELKQFLRERLDNDGLAFQALLRGYHLLDNVFVTASGRDSRFVRAETLVDEALSWTEGRTDWFAWLHPMDVHAPYEAPPAYQREFLDEPVSRVRSQKLARTQLHHPEEMSEDDWEVQRRLYRAECRYLDDQLDRLLGALADRGVREETVVVFTADHGDMHGEHGRGGHPQEFWEEVIRVPLAVDVPDGPAATVDGQVGLVDLPPTVLDVLGIDAPDRWDGRSVWSRVEESEKPREHVFVDVGAELDRDRAGVRRADGWKLLRHGEKEYLFDLADNPVEDENRSRIESDPETYRRLSASLDDHLDAMARRRRAGQAGVENEEMIEDHLKELGYLE